MSVNFPQYEEEMIQYWAGSWWETYTSHEYKRGELIWAFLPHVSVVPMQLIPVGRQEREHHGSAVYKMQQIDVNSHKIHVKRSDLPVAAMPIFSNETLCVYRAKKRPALIISTGGDEIAQALRQGKSKWTTAPTLLAAPYYGNDKDGNRQGVLTPELRDLVVRCSYPQFMLEKLPLNGGTVESVLRLDHIQPVGKHHNSIEKTGFCLTPEASELLDQWLDWLIEGKVPSDCFLSEFRKDICRVVV